MYYLVSCLRIIYMHMQVFWPEAHTEADVIEIYCFRPASLHLDHIHGVYHRIRRIASLMGTPMGEEPNQWWTGPAASVVRPNRTGGVDSLLLASCPFPVQLGNPRLLQWRGGQLACGTPLYSTKWSCAQWLGSQTTPLHVGLDCILVTPNRTTLWTFAWQQLSKEDLFGYPVVLHEDDMSNSAKLCCQ